MFWRRCQRFSSFDRWPLLLSMSSPHLKQAAHPLPPQSGSVAVTGTITASCSIIVAPYSGSIRSSRVTRINISSSLPYVDTSHPQLLYSSVHHIVTVVIQKLISYYDIIVSRYNITEEEGCVKHSYASIPALGA